MVSVTDMLKGALMVTFALAGIVLLQKIGRIWSNDWKQINVGRLVAIIAFIALLTTFDTATILRNWIIVLCIGALLAIVAKAYIPLNMIYMSVMLAILAKAMVGITKSSKRIPMLGYVLLPILIGFAGMLLHHLMFPHKWKLVYNPNTSYRTRWSWQYQKK